MASFRCSGASMCSASLVSASLPPQCTTTDGGITVLWGGLLCRFAATSCTRGGNASCYHRVLYGDQVRDHVRGS
eukprot:6530421-Pyramimonas_sp.AAC.1